MTERWTPDTEELVARMIFTGFDFDKLVPSAPARTEMAEVARRVLTALADAGLLVPPDGFKVADVVLKVTDD